MVAGWCTGCVGGPDPLVWHVPDHSLCGSVLGAVRTKFEATDSHRVPGSGNAAPWSSHLFLAPAQDLGRLASLETRAGSMGPLFGKALGYPALGIPGTQP